MAEPDARAGLAVASVRTFLASAILWNIGLVGLLRWPWVADHVIGALIHFQTSLIFWYGATPNHALVVDASCSGGDVAALCAAITLSYPVAWRRRIAGALTGLLVIVVLNTARVASLYAVASSPDTLTLLHLYVWPAGLVAAAVAYVWLWIRWSERGTPAVGGGWPRFFKLSLGGLTAYAAAAPWVFTSATLGAVGVWTASAAASTLALLGCHVSTTGNVLVTPRGAFQVTQECLFTPLIPLYIAAALSLPLQRWARVAWVSLGVPLFFVLGITRVLVLALPSSIAERPMFLAHGFYQILAGCAAIVVAAHVAFRGGSARAVSARAATALGAAAVGALAVGPAWHAVLLGLAEAVQRAMPAAQISFSTPADGQGALAMLPAFQIGLTLGLWVAMTGGRRWATLVPGCGTLAVSQIALLSLLGWLAVEGLHPHALGVRAWALAIPLALAVVAWLPVEGTVAGDATYRRFWQDTGETFPVLTGAASTEYYFANEKRLLTETFPTLAGMTLLKTDLWDEAKNTRILQWVAGQGAKVVGIDISEPIVHQARAAFEGRRLRPVVSDVRRLPFVDDSFDAIYSMGTVEHFVETEASVAELARILKPSGRLILGVPNRHDPFLRPLLVAALSRLGLYAYGFEKSYSRRSLRKMLEAAGLEVRSDTGILFMPGWLRMLDLWCHTRARPLAVVTAALVAPFVWLDRRFSRLRRHGYLVVAVGEKPAGQVVAPTHARST
jgi:exosortase/archaeosortase family protein